MRRRRRIRTQQLIQEEDTRYMLPYIMNKTVIFAIIAMVVIVAVTIAITQSLVPGLSLLSPSSVMGNNNSSNSNDNNSNSSSSNSNINNTTGQE
jgi:hypothetical protein